MRDYEKNRLAGNALSITFTNYLYALATQKCNLSCSVSNVDRYITPHISIKLVRNNVYFIRAIIRYIGSIMPNVPLIRIFLSSPSDVTLERQIAHDIIARLPNRPVFREKVALRVIDWDRPDTGTPMRAKMTPQEAINMGLPKPSECDLVVSIFWSRMGTPFEFEGKQYLSGSHWELLDALDSQKSEVLIYRRTEKIQLTLGEDDIDERKHQYDTLNSFFDSDRFKQGNNIKAGLNLYESPEEFGRRFEYDLESIVKEILDRGTENLSNSSGEIYETNIWKGSPFPGLRPFTEDDALIFFGRGRELDSLISLLEQNRFVAVIGPSGSGKSSLVAAGLVPRLRSNSIATQSVNSAEWKFVTFTPTTSDHNINLLPFGAVYEALLSSFPEAKPSLLESDRRRKQFMKLAMQDSQHILDHSEALLAGESPWTEILFVVDQFEEIFTLVDEDVRDEFIRALSILAKGQKTRVILTVRSDFYQECLQYYELTELLQGRTFPLTTPKPDQMYEMIVKPADQAALEFERGLPVTILSDTGAEPGSLALMAYVLDELYKISHSNGQSLLSFEDYDALGGVQGAIGTRAEEIFSLNDAFKHLNIVNIFRELVEVDSRGIATRRRSSLRNFSSDPHAMTFIEAFIDARLLTTSGQEQDRVVEVSHEALLSNWPRLNDWIEAYRDDLRLLSQLRIASKEWDQSGRPDYLLWNHQRLSFVYEMIERLQPDLDLVTEEFVTPEADRLLLELEDNISHLRRSQIGERLAAIGDPRQGVGLINGIPDIEWCWIPGGRVDIRGEEFYVHPFFISKYLITYEQFQAFVDHSYGFGHDDWWTSIPDRYKKQPIDTSSSAYGNYPRDSISWYQCIAFTRWLNTVLRSYEWPSDAGRDWVVRLPTEWEWQWVAEGGHEKRNYPWGDEWNPNNLNSKESALDERTTAVGMYPSGISRWGPLDMAGNLAEWCLNSSGDLLNISVESDTNKVIRGGSCIDRKRAMKNTVRDFNSPNAISRYGGLRPVLAVRYPTQKNLEGDT